MGSLWVIHKPVWQSGVISHWHCPALPQSRSDVDVQRYLECSALPWGRGGLELSRTYKDVGFSFANTVKKIMTMFKLDEKEAEKAVKERWDEPAENSSGEK